MEENILFTKSDGKANGLSKIADVNDNRRER